MHGPDVQWFRPASTASREPSDGVRVPLAAAGVAVVASAVVFWFAPLLGALMMMGSVAALAVVLGPIGAERVGRWLSGFR